MATPSAVDIGATPLLRSALTAANIRVPITPVVNALRADGWELADLQDSQSQANIAKTIEEIRPEMMPAFKCRLNNAIAKMAEGIYESPNPLDGSLL